MVADNPCRESDYPERRGQGEAHLLSGGDRTAPDGYQRRGHKVPCLFIDGNPMYESDDIIMWLRENPQD